MKKLRLIVVITLLMASCAQQEEKGAKGVTIGMNTTIIVDLSDRILIEESAKDDLDVIDLAFNDWIEKNGPLYGLSRGVFTVVVLNGEGKKVNFETKINLARDSLVNKNDIVAKGKSFIKKMKNFYDQMVLDGSPSKMYGVDFLTYFENEFGYDLPENKLATKVLILTDGMVLLNDDRFEHCEGYCCRTMNQMQKMRLANAEHWERIYDSAGYALQPFVFPTRQDVDVSLIGANNKNYDENKMIRKTWQNWFKASGSKEIKIVNAGYRNNQIVKIIKTWEK